ncbi:MAG: type IX secretion system membrane protein PorP/SprF [Bacteroidales bacterium]
MKKILISCLLFIGLFQGTVAQNDASFTQYMFNESIFNPASISISNTLNASLVARQQWVGFDNAPASQMLNINTYLQQIFGGVGLNVIHDQLGYERFLTIRGHYAFPVQLTEAAHLTFGLGAGVMSRTLDGTGLTYEDMNDPNAYLGSETFTRPDFNFGMEYVDSNLTAGFAVNHLYRSSRNAGIDYPPRHYYFYAKYRIMEVAEDIDIEPYILLKSSWRSTQLDINVIGYYDNTVWAGFSYRTGDAVAAMLGYYISPGIRVGYSYDYSVGVNRRYSGGSHEIMLLTTFGGFNKDKISPQTPRIFN